MRKEPHQVFLWDHERDRKREDSVRERGRSSGTEPGLLDCFVSTPHLPHQRGAWEWAARWG